MTDKKSAYLYPIGALAIWGSLYVVSKAVLDKVPPFTTSFFRYFIAGIAIYFVIRFKGLSFGVIKRKDYKYLFIIGFFGYFMSIGLQLLGTKLSTASVASLINSMAPITVMFFAAVMLGEKLTFKKVLCLVSAVAGTYIIIGGVSGSGRFWGVVVSVISVSLWSLASVIVRKISFKYDALIITFYCIIIGMVFTIPAAVLEITISDYIKFDVVIILSLLYMGIICTAFAYILWNKGLAEMEAGVCSLFYPIQPAVSAALGAIFLNERIGGGFIAGASLILIGVLFTVTGRKKVLN